MEVILDPELPHTVVIEQEPGMYLISTRASTWTLLEKYGDKIFDPAPDRHANGGGSGRGLQ